MSYLQDKDFVAFDTETTGVDKESKVVGYSICAEVELGWYVVLSYWDKEQNQLLNTGLHDPSVKLLSLLQTKNLIMHNAPFDCARIKDNFDIELMESLKVDTMILAHIVDENRPNGLKDLGISLFGDDADKEQKEMKESVHKNGGVLTKDKYELYKADSELLGRYGAKDAILTLKIFYTELPKLYDQKLDTFFFEESMPLLKGTTYCLNNTGMKVDSAKLQKLKQELETECLEAKGFIYKEIQTHVDKEYPGTSKAKTFNIGSPKQLSWLLFFKLGNQFNNLTKEGREVCKSLGLKLPYTAVAKREFTDLCNRRKDTVYTQSMWNPKTRKMSRPKKIGNYWNYLACGKDTLEKLAPRYKWVATYLQYAKNKKLLNTYVEGIQQRLKYSVIYPGFLQNVVPSGRYASRNPNFQNLPRDDKRVSFCIISRPDKAFIGCDYPQIEPRTFASFSGDARLLQCFKSREDFYSVIGISTFDKYDATPMKEGDTNAFGVKYPELRQISKVIGLSIPYGTTASKLSPLLKKPIDECQEIIDLYFDNFPSIKEMMENRYKEVIETGQVTNLFGRPRRILKAMEIPKKFKGIPYDRLPYEWRNLLNLAVNYPIQSTAASIMNRASIRFLDLCNQLSEEEALWKEVKIVLQRHDELIAEGPIEISESIKLLLKECMENTVTLPGVDLPCDPKIAYNLAELK